MSQSHRASDRDSDLTLVARMARGDAAALRILFDRHGPQLLAAASRILNSRSRAEDALQEAFVAIWRTAGRFQDRPQGTVFAWMYSIVRFKAIDMIRAEQRQAQAAQDNADMSRDTVQPTAEDAALSADERRRLQECIDGLDNLAARLIRTAFVHGYSHAELSEVSGQPLGTVKSRIRRGLTALKRCLER